MPEPNGVRRTIEAAGGVQVLADAWGVSRAFVHQCDKKGYFPLERAKQAASTYGVPLRDLVAPDIAEAMSIDQGDQLLS